MVLWFVAALLMCLKWVIAKSLRAENDTLCRNKGTYVKRMVEGIQIQNTLLAITFT